MTTMDVVEVIERWVPMLGLGSWEVRHSELAPDDDESRASTDIDCIRRRAIIRLDAGVPDSQVEREVVHELLHILMADMEDVLNRGIHEINSEVAAFLRGQWERAQEWAIERLASKLTGTDVEFWQLTPKPRADEPWASGFQRSAT